MTNHLISLFNRIKWKFKQREVKVTNTNTVKNLNKDSVVILVPVSHHIEPSVDDALRKLETFGYTVWRKYGWSAIDQGRCVLAQEALDAGFEHLVWIDADVSFWPYDVEKLISQNLLFVSCLIV